MEKGKTADLKEEDLSSRSSKLWTTQDIQDFEAFMHKAMVALKVPGADQPSMGRCF